MDTQKKTTQEGRQGGFKRGGNRPGGRPMAPREKPEFEQKIIAIRRVTRVVSGGRRMSFSVAMVIGDKKGSVGLGTGKAVDTALAIAKALKSAKKNLIKIKVTKDMSIARPVEAKYCSSKVSITPNKAKGIVSGSAVRDVVNLAGLKNVTTKIHSGSKNKLNNAGAALKALAEISEKRSVREVLKEE
jgi:small subunit ribosomal protein S5